MLKPSNYDKYSAEVKKIYEIAYREASKEGNTDITCKKMALGAIQELYKEKEPGVWVKRKDEEKKEGVKILAQTAPILYKEGEAYKAGDVITRQFCSVGDNVTDKELNDFIENFQNNAYGQPIGLHVNHPFFRQDDQGVDKKRYGDILKVERKGSEGWIDIRLNSLGAESLNDHQYIGLSPGWWETYKHAETGRNVKNVLFEVSMTNVPAEKLMNTIVQLSEEMNDIEYPWREMDFNHLTTEITEMINSFTGMKNRFKDDKLKMKILEKGKKLLTDLLKEFVNTLEENPDPGGSDNIKVETKEEPEMSNEIKEVKKTEEIPVDVNKFITKEEHAKTLEEKEARIKTLEEKLRRGNITKKLSEYLPREGSDEYKIKKETADKIPEFCMKLSEEAEGEFFQILSEMPSVTVNTKNLGVTGTTPKTAEERKADLEKKESAKKKTLSEDEKVDIALKYAEENCKGDKSEHSRLYKSKMEELDKA